MDFLNIFSILKISFEVGTMNNHFDNKNHLNHLWHYKMLKHILPFGIYGNED